MRRGPHQNREKENRSFSADKPNQGYPIDSDMSNSRVECCELPYMKLLSRLFGRRLVLANRNKRSVNNVLRQSPLATSLFNNDIESAIEKRNFSDEQMESVMAKLQEMRGELDTNIIDDLLKAPKGKMPYTIDQRYRISKLKLALLDLKTTKAKEIESSVDHLLKSSVWLIGGDEWLEVESNRLDMILKSGKNINVIILDTEDYSEGISQNNLRSKKIEIVLNAMRTGDIYIAQVAINANPQQASLSLREAETYPGPSLILATGYCKNQIKSLVDGSVEIESSLASTYWPLMRFNPAHIKLSKNPLSFDSNNNKIQWQELGYSNRQFQELSLSDPKKAVEIIDNVKNIQKSKTETFKKLALSSLNQLAPVA